MEVPSLVPPLPGALGLPSAARRSGGSWAHCWISCHLQRESRHAGHSHMVTWISVQKTERFQGVLAVFYPGTVSCRWQHLHTPPVLVVLGPQSIHSYPSSFFSGTIHLLLYNSKWGWKRVLLSPVPLVVSSGSCSFKSLSTPRFLGLWLKALTWDKEQVSTYGIMLNCCKSCRGRGASKLY